MYMKMTRKDYIQALVAYFNVKFTHCHHKVMFSTGPHSSPTHWKQTVFYLRDHITAKEGEEEVTGNFKMWKNNRNSRDLDFEIRVQHHGELKSLREINFYRMR